MGEVLKLLFENLTYVAPAAHLCNFKSFPWWANIKLYFHTFFTHVMGYAEKEGLLKV